MARQEQVRLVDDLDGSPATVTVTFGLDGQTYELDLTDEHAAELEALFAPYVDAGRQAGRQVRRPVRRAASSARTSVADNVAVRAWAQQHGLTMSRRGRIPDHVRQAYAERSVMEGRALQQPEPLSGLEPRSLPPVTDPFAVTEAS